MSNGYASRPLTFGLESRYTMNSDMIQNSAPYLPTELTDLIIDHLACNLYNNLVPQRPYCPHVLAPLIACSTVSKAVHNRTLHHIFSTVILTESSLSQYGNKRQGHRKQTISGLLDILDSDSDDKLRRSIRTLKLYTAPMHLPTKSAWGDVDEDFPSILRDASLSRLLSKLTWICSFHILHQYPKPFQYSDLSDETKLGIEGILHGRFLSRLELVGFSAFPPSFLTRCSYLTKLECHNYIWPFYYSNQNVRSVVWDHSIESTSYSNLQYACFTGCNNLVEELIAGELVIFLRNLWFNIRIYWALKMELSPGSRPSNTTWVTSPISWLLQRL